jgi:ATP-binding cassette subfamily B protein
VVLLAYGGRLVARGQLTLGDLVVFAGLLQQFGGQVSNLANIVNTLQQSLISARRVFEVLDAPIEVASDATALKPARFQGTVRFEQLSFEYHPGTRALDAVDFEVRAGQRVVLFGETGAGKSTLLSMIPRFYDPCAGRVTIDGHELRQIDLESLRAQIGVVFQESFLFSASIADNLAFGRPEASRAEIMEAARLACAHDFIAALPAGTTPSSRRVGPTCRAASGSAWPSPGPSCAIHRSCCWTIPRRPSIPRPRARCCGRWSRWPGGAPPSWPPTAWWPAMAPI